MLFCRTIQGDIPHSDDLVLYEHHIARHTGVGGLGELVTATDTFPIKSPTFLAANLIGILTIIITVPSVQCLHLTYMFMTDDLQISIAIGQLASPVDSTKY